MIEVKKQLWFNIGFLILVFVLAYFIRITSERINLLELEIKKVNPVYQLENGQTISQTEIFNQILKSQGVIK